MHEMQLAPAHRKINIRLRPRLKVIYFELIFLGCRILLLLLLLCFYPVDRDYCFLSYKERGRRARGHPRRFVIYIELIFSGLPN